MSPNTFFLMNSRSSGQPKNYAKTLFFHPPAPFHGNFCNCNSIGICTASWFWVQLPLLYTAWSNAYSEIGSEVRCDLLRLLAQKITKCIHSSKPALLNRPTDIWPYFTPNCTVVLWGCVLSWMAFGLHKVHTHLPCSSFSDWCWLERHQFSQAKAKFAWSAKKLLPVRIHIGIRTQIFRQRCDAKNISDLYLNNICCEIVHHLSVSFGQITHGFAFRCNTCYLPLS